MRQSVFLYRKSVIRKFAVKSVRSLARDRIEHRLGKRLIALYRGIIILIFESALAVVEIGGVISESSRIKEIFFVIVHAHSVVISVFGKLYKMTDGGRIHLPVKSIVELVSLALKLHGYFYFGMSGIAARHHSHRSRSHNAREDDAYRLSRFFIKKLFHTTLRLFKKIYQYFTFNLPFSQVLLIEIAK